MSEQIFVNKTMEKSQQKEFKILHPKTKNILITGSSGMIGRELMEILEKNRDNNTFLYTADLKQGEDLRNFKECLDLCHGMDEVYHLAGIKGSPKMTKEKPADFMKMLQFDVNMIYAAQEKGVKKFLYTSSIAVEHPEDDKYPAWAKKTAETLIEAMRIQYPDGTKYCVVRPANVYGRYDYFKNPNAMVITSLIRKGLDHSPFIEVWGDGTQVRDFINSKDVARGMILTMEKMPDQIINLCSGVGVKIKDIVDLISGYTNKTPKYTGENKGTQSRVMIPNHKIVGLQISATALIDGIQEVIEWAKKSMK